MESIFSVYSIICFILGIFLIFFGLITMRKLHDTSSRLFTLMMFEIAVYVFGYGFELASVNIEVMKIMLKVEYFGVSFLPALWIMFAYSYKKNYIPIKMIFLLSVIPFITLILAVTNEYHGLIYSKLELKKVEKLSIAVLEGGIWYWVHMFYFNFSMIVSTVLFINTFRKSNSIYKKHIVIIIFGSMFTWIAYIIYLSGYSPYGIDTTPFGLGITVIIFFMGILKYKLVEILPVARDIVFENIREGVIVIDRIGQIADFNKSASVMLKELNSKSIGESIVKIFEKYGNVYEKLMENGSTILCIEGEFEEKKYLELTMDKIENSTGAEVGKTVLVQNVTENINMIQELEKLATTDELTGVCNRRHLIELSVRESMLAKRYKKATAVAVIDIDFFKKINDTKGHLEGDRILEKSAEIIKKRLRRTDIFGRYGGDEFIITFPETDSVTAYNISEEIREELNSELQIGLSIGVCGNKRGEIVFRDMLRFADEALYISKQNGRNRTTIYGGKE